MDCCKGTEAAVASKFNRWCAYAAGNSSMLLKALWTLRSTQTSYFVVAKPKRFFNVRANFWFLRDPPTKDTSSYFGEDPDSSGLTLGAVTTTA